MADSITFEKRIEHEEQLKKLTSDIRNNIMNVIYVEMTDFRSKIENILKDYSNEDQKQEIKEMTKYILINIKSRLNVDEFINDDE